MKALLVVITCLSMNAWSQEASNPQNSTAPQESLKQENSFEHAPTGQLRSIAQATNSIFIPQSLIPDEGLLVVQPQLFMPDRKHTSDRKVFTLNQGSED